MKLHHQKKGQAAGGVTNIVLAVGFAAIAFLVAGIILSYGALVNSNVNSGIGCNTGFTYNTTSGGCDNSTAHTGTNTPGAILNNVTSGLNTFGTNMPTIAQVIVAVLVISLLFLGFGGLISRAGGGTV
jgi:hypothetical protein